MRKRIEIQNPSEVHEEVSLVAFRRDKAELIKSISALEIQHKKLQEAEKEMKEAMKAAMEEYGVKSFSIGEGDDAVTFTYVGETTQNSVDTTALKKDHPELVAKYMKTSPRAAYVTAKVGGKKK